MRSFSTQLSSAILIFACFLLSNRAWSQVAIGTSGSSPTPNSKAVLLLEGKDQGLILPVVSGLTAVGATGSEKGMVVFNSADNKVYYFDGTNWLGVGSGGTGSNLIQISGNTITLGVGASSVNLATGFSNSARGFLYWNGTSWVQAQFTLPSTTQALVYNPGTSSWGFQTLSAGGGITTLSTSGSYLTVANPTGPTATITANPITNTDISATAAIAGSKITPAFGTQNISTTGTLTTGAATVSGLTIGTSVWPANASGVLTNNGTGTLTWAAAPNPILGGDLSGTASTATVTRLQGQNVSATVPTAGQVLQFISGSWTPAPLTGGGTVTNVTASAPINVATGSTTPVLSLNPLTDTDISATAAIAGTKINPAFGSQNITTTTGSASIGGGLNVGLANGLQISNAGNFTRINNIATSFPAAQGAANTYLRNDGAGNLSWSTVAGGTDVTTQNGVLTGNGSTISGVASLPVNLGGTGATSLSGLVVGNGTSALTAITTGTNGQVLTVNAGVPSWQNPTTSGAAGGDLTGTYPNPTIATGAVTSTKIATGAVGTTNIAATAVDDSKIANVAPGKILQASATSGQVLKWNGSTWAPAPDAVGGGGAPTLNPGQIIVGDGSTNSGATMSLDASLNSTNGNVTVQGLQGRPISTAVPASNSVYQFNGTQWIPVVLSGGGTVSSIATGTGLTGGPITGTGTISIAPGGVTSTELATGAVGNTNIAASAVNSSQIVDGTITDADISGTAAIAVTKLATGTNGQVLTVNAGVPSWQNASGLTNPMTTAGDLIYGGVGGTPTRLATGTGFLKGGATPSYSAVGLASTDVTGVLPIANGGTGAATAPLARTSLGLGTLATLSTVTSSEITDGTIADADISGTAAIAVTKLATGTNGQVLTVNAGVPSWQTPSGGGSVTTVSVTSANGFTGSVATPTTTPAITIGTSLTGVLKGNGTAMSVATGSDLPVMTATVGGAVPTPPNNTTTFLRGDGTFAVPAGGGTVTTVSVTPANGFTGSVATATSTPAITIGTSLTGLLKGNGTALALATAGTDYQAPITLTTTGTSGAATLVGNTLNVPNYSSTAYLAGTGLTLTTNTFSVNTSQNISTLSNLTTNGLIKTSGGTGALSIATAGTDYLTPTGSAAGLTGLLPAQIPSLDASKITTGSFAVAQIPNLDASKITTGTLPVANGGTGLGTFGTGGLLYSTGTTNLGTVGNGSAGQMLLITGTTPTWQTMGGDATMTGTGTVTIANNAITDAKVAAAAAIAGTKISPNFGAQNIVTTGTLTTGTAGAFAVNATGNITKINNVTTSFPAANAAGVLTNDGTGTLTWAVGSGWGLTGNAGTNPATNFIGTTDAQPLRFATGVGGVERMRLDATGNLGFGINAPLSKFHLKQSVQVNDVLTDVGSGFFGGGLMFENAGTTDSYYIGYGNGGYFRIGSKSAANVFTGMVYASPTGVGIFSPVPTEKLDVTGNIKFSGALMPNNLPGTAGQVLTSAGPGLPPTWSAAGSGWGLTGNAGTVDGTNFVGTTDNIPFNIRVNNQKAGRIEGASPFGTFYGYQAGQNNGAAQANVAIGYQALTGVTSASNTAIGYQTLQNTNGGQNTAVGSSALTAASSGAGNTAVGQAALANATTANFNTAVGLLAMQFTTGGNNAALGSNAGQFNSSGQTNVFVGYQAGFPNATVANSNTSGSNNTFIGPNTGLGSSTQRTNATAIGANATVNADNSLVLGSINGVNGATATVNVGIGTSAPINRLHINEPSIAGNFLRITNNPSPNGLTIGLSGSGSQEAFIANNENAAMYFQTNAANRMAIDATGNVGINKIAPSEKLDVAGNVRFSGAIMPNNLPGTSGQVLTSAGAGLPPTWTTPSGSLISNPGTFNLFAGSGVSTASTDNAIFGANAGANNTGPYNVIIGANAAINKTTGSLSTIIGWFAGKVATNDGNTLIGAQAGENTTSSINTFLGEKAGQTNTTGMQNTFIGDRAGSTPPEGGTFGNTTGSNNMALGTFATMQTGALTNATAIGYRATVTQSNSLVLGSINGVNTATSNTNVGIGTTAPSWPLTVAANNADYGIRLDQGSTTGNGLLVYANTTSSAQTLLSVQSNVTGLVVLGNGTAGLGRTPTANQLEISGNASKAAAGGWLANSDRRIKTDIRDIDNSLELIRRIHPVKYKYTAEWMKRNPSIKDQYYYSFIAQEYQQVFPEAVQGSGEFLKGDKEEILQIDTHNAQMVTIKAVQEQQKIIETQQQEILTLKKELEQIKSYLGMEAKATKKKKERK